MRRSRLVHFAGNEQAQTRRNVQALRFGPEVLVHFESAMGECGFIAKPFVGDGKFQDLTSATACQKLAHISLEIDGFHSNLKWGF